VLVDGLTSPFGMALVGGELHVADTDALLRLPYCTGQTRIDARPAHVAALSAGPD
jgi:glucose/arabinose dehydrogenase